MKRWIACSLLIVLAGCGDDPVKPPDNNNPPPPSNANWDRLQGGIGVDTFLGVTALSDGSFYVVHEGGVLRLLHGDWTQEHVPAGGPLRAVWGSARGRAYAVGDDGRVVARTSSGWTEQTPSTSAHLTDVSGNATTVIAVGDDNGAGIVLRLNGATWEFVPSTFASPLRGVWVAPDGTFAVVGDDAALSLHTDAGWTDLSPGSGEDLLDVWGTSLTNLYAVGSNGYVFHVDRADGGDPVPFATSHTFRCVWGLSASDVRVAGDDGDLRVFNGTDWSSATTRVDSDLHCMAGVTTSEVLAVGSGGTILGGYGALWMPLYRSPTYTLEGVWTDGYEYIAAGTRADGGGIATDGFDIWEFPEAQHVASGFLGDAVYVMGDAGLIRRSNFGDWVPEPVLTSESLRAATGLRTRFGEPFRLYVVGDNGTLLVQRNGTWGLETLPAGAENFDFVDVWAAATDDVFAVASNSNQVVRYDDPTENGPWTLEQTPAAGNLLGIGGIELTTYAVSDRGEILRHNGSSWEMMQSPVNTPLRDVRAITRTGAYAVGDNAVALVFDGAAWRPSELAFLGDLRSVHGWDSSKVFSVGSQGAVFSTIP